MEEMGRQIITNYTSYDVFLSKKLPFRELRRWHLRKNFSGINFLSRLIS